MTHTTEKQKIGLTRATSLVTGNMIGSGIFLLPASLALYGSISFIGWIISGIGTIFLAIVFSRLSKILPRTGGPYAYAKEGFGEFSGFLTAWSYWISILATNAGIAIAFTGYFGVFFPFVTSSTYATAVTSILAVWLLTYVNTRGTAMGANVQLITTILKVVPLLTISLIGLFFIDLDNFQAFNISGQSNFQAILATLTLTLFALLGVESATIPAGDIDQPEKTIGRATLIGTALVVFIYVLSSAVIMGLISPDSLQTSNAPFADAADIIFGPTGKYLIALGAIFSTFGALNGWILLQGQIAMAPANDRLFPKIFGKLNNKNAPHAGLIISSILVSFFVVSNYSKGLVAMFTFIILVSTFAVCIPYLFSALAELMVVSKMKNPDRSRIIKASIYGVPAFIYSLMAIIGSPKDVVFYGFIFLVLGIPIYVYAKFQKSK